jgi:hypothetical protein
LVGRNWENENRVEAVVGVKSQEKNLGGNLIEN